MHGQSSSLQYWAISRPDWLTNGRIAHLFVRRPARPARHAGRPLPRRARHGAGRPASSWTSSRSAHASAGRFSRRPVCPRIARRRCAAPFAALVEDPAFRAGFRDDRQRAVGPDDGRRPRGVRRSRTRHFTRNARGLPSASSASTDERSRTGHGAASPRSHTARHRTRPPRSCFENSLAAMFDITPRVGPARCPDRRSPWRRYASALGPGRHYWPRPQACGSVGVSEIRSSSPHPSPIREAPRSAIFFVQRVFPSAVILGVLPCEENSLGGQRASERPRNRWRMRAPRAMTRNHA